MRADAHYVDQLTSRRVEKPFADPLRTLAPTSEGTDDHGQRERDRRREGISAQLAEHVATMSSAAALLAGRASALAQRLNVDLIRAEAWQASWLLEAQTILDGTHLAQVRSRRIGTMLERLRQGFAPSCRLRRIDLQIRATDADAMVAVDEGALVAGLSGAVAATLGLLETIEGATVKIAADALAGELRTVEVSQDEIAVPTHASLRFFDLAWVDRPGGWPTAIGAATAKAVAQLHGGNAVLLVGERRGTVVRMNFARY